MDDEPIVEEGVHRRHGKESAEVTAKLEELEEEFQCGVCFNLSVLPTTLSCGHSFCRHCLAQWFDFGKKMECPTCRQAFVDLPMVNVQMKSALQKMLGSKYEALSAGILDNTENKAAIDGFESLVKKRHSDDEISATCGGCLLGTALSLIVISCIYLAIYWGSSDMDLLVKKPMARWTVDDVSDWLRDLGLEDYQQNFTDQKINGRILNEINQSNLEPMFGMRNELHQRVILQALEYTKAHGVKQPTNLWEHKAVYSRYTTFLLYAMGHTPRLALLYLYKYDEPGFEFYTSTVEDCGGNTTANHSTSIWTYIGMTVAPDYMNAKFALCFTELHFWTSRFIILQCACRGILEMMSFIAAVRNPRDIQVTSTISESILMAMVYYVVSCIWWLIPTIMRDALFYAELYFSPAFYIRDMVRRGLWS